VFLTPMAVYCQTVHSSMDRSTLHPSTMSTNGIVVCSGSADLIMAKDPHCVCSSVQLVSIIPPHVQKEGYSLTAGTVSRMVPFVISQIKSTATIVRRPVQQLTVLRTRPVIPPLDVDVPTVGLTLTAPVVRCAVIGTVQTTADPQSHIIPLKLQSNPQTNPQLQRYPQPPKFQPQHVHHLLQPRPHQPLLLLVLLIAVLTLIVRLDTSVWMDPVSRPVPRTQTAMVGTLCVKHIHTQTVTGVITNFADLAVPRM